MGQSGSSTALQTCLNTVANGRSGFVAYPSDPLYQISWVKRFNLDVPVTPIAVVRPSTAQDVSDAIKCAAASNVKVQAKSGGHSYANYGLGGQDGALALDLVNLQQFSMDNTTWQATIGPGTRLGHVTTNLHDNGGRAMAHGVCPGVGIGGHATIGGLGPMSRMWGSALDHVLEVEVVTADGSIQRANENQNADLFWALKGAGASIGVITEFVVKTHPEPGNVVQYSYTFSFGQFKDIAAVYKQWQDVISDPNLDRRFGSNFILYPLGAIITGTFYGSQADWDASGIASRLPQGGSSNLVINDWLGSLAHDAENEALYLSDIATPFYSKNLAFKYPDALSTDSVNDVFDWLDTADAGTLLWFIIFDAQGGATNDIPMNATAYAHRDKLMFYQSYAIGIPLSQTTKDFLTAFDTKVRTTDPDAFGMYAGYVDPQASTPQQQYWGPNYARLQQVKAKFDSGDLFHNPQSVQLP